MKITKKLSAIGTNDFSSSSHLLVYNSNTFYNENIIKSLNLSEVDINLLREDISNDNVVDKVSRLISISEFELIPKNTDNLFYFYNDKFNCLRGQGFNIIVFLMKKENTYDIIGYAELLKVYGYNYQEINTSYDLRRDYITSLIKISIKKDGNEVRIDLDNIRLVDNILENKKDLPYYKISSNILGDKLNIHNNYNNSLLDIINGSKAKDIITNCNFCKYVDGNFIVSKLHLNRNLILKEDYKNFNNFQIGYYKGSPAIYIWNDNNEYSIYSLVKNILLGDVSYPYSITIPRADKDGNLISGTELYKLPQLNGVNLKIDHFSGRYIICTSENGSRYLFDIELQSGRDIYPNNGWVISEKRHNGTYSSYRKNSENIWELDSENINPPSSTKIYESLDIVPSDKTQAVVKNKYPIYANNFLLDSMDPKNKIEFFTSNWQYYINIIKDSPIVSSLFINSEKLLNKGCNIINRIGSWVVFETPDRLFKIYSNHTKSIKFGVNESNIFIVNDQVLIARDENNYIIYDEDGFFMSRSAKDLMDLNNLIIDNSVIYNRDVKIYDEKLDSSKFLNILNLKVPSDIQKSFLRYYRRNCLPPSIDNFEIIGCLGGIIFYRIENNKINFL